MKEQLEKIFANATEDLSKAVSINDLEEIRGKYLSRKGEFNEIKKNLKNLSNEDKRVVGSLANEITKKLEEGLKAKHDEFYRKELNEKLSKVKDELEDVKLILSVSRVDVCLALPVKLHYYSVAKSCPTLCSPLDCSTPGFPVLQELAQTYVH